MAILTWTSFLPGQVVRWLDVVLGLQTSDSMLANVVLLALAVVLITKGGNLFTDSAINVARATRIPPALIGATIVSMATTFPELMVSLTGVLRGSASLGVGNALGSCCCNIGLIVGSCAVINGIISYLRGVNPGITAARNHVVVPAMFMLAGAVSLWAFEAAGASAKTPARALLAWHGVTLGLILVAYLAYSTVFAARARSSSDRADEDADATNRAGLRGLLAKELVLFAVGATLVFLGSRQLVVGATQIAKAFHVSQLVIGLTIVAVGTSLPEYTIALLSVLKGHGELGIGNIMGANILNICGVLAACSLVSPLPIEPRSMTIDLPVMLLLMVLLTITVLRQQRVSTLNGAAMLGIYGFYMVLMRVA